MSLNEDYYSILTDNLESWSAAPRKRTQTLPATNFNIPKKQDDSSPITFNKADIFGSDFWSSPNAKSCFASSPSHKRTLSEEFSQNRTSTYDNVPLAQSGSAGSKPYNPVGDHAVEPPKLSPSLIRNGVDCLVPENTEGNTCDLLASALEEMKIQNKLLEQRVKR